MSGVEIFLGIVLFLTLIATILVAIFFRDHLQWHVNHEENIKNLNERVKRLEKEL